MTKNRSTGLIALILGAAVAVGAYQLPESTIVGDIGPAVFPFISAALLIVCGIGMLITGGKKESSPLDAPGALRRLALIFGVVLVYCIAMTYLGFVVPTIAVLFALATMFSEETEVPWWHKLLYAAAITLAIYLLFHNVLNLKLPENQLF